MSVLRALLVLVFVFVAASSALPTPLASRESRALAPSVESWCIFYPEKCRMLKFAGVHKRDFVEDLDY
ncbi:unnamed protein product [Caenorhabditis sp. 36 PRJEB53466]|nr:unnamed protein product [Caenorhabditis sp. 36 PRJEB53466]